MAENGTSFLRAPTTPQHIIAAIRADLLSGDLRPGDHVGQDELAARLNVSRIPIREALSVLASEGPLIYRPYHGYRVATLTRKDTEEIGLALTVLETTALRAAVPQARDSVIEELQAVLGSMLETRDRRVYDFMTSYEEFRFKLFGEAKMPLFEKLIRSVWHLCDAYRLGWLSNPDARRYSCETHSSVLEALQTRNVDLVVDVMNEHRRFAIGSISNNL